MSILVLSAVIGAALIIAAVLAVLWFDGWDRKRSVREPLVPEFTPRRDTPRAITRITRDQLDWEIN